MMALRQALDDDAEIAFEKSFIAYSQAVNDIPGKYLPKWRRSQSVATVAWVERSDKIAEGDFGQPEAGPKGSVH